MDSFSALQPPLLLGDEGEVVTGSAAHPFALPTGTVTFLLTDVEGSTRQWQQDPELMGPAIARHYEILGDAIAAAGGVRPVEQGEGDSVVGAFSRATDAVAAAVEAQRALAAEVWPDGVAISVRMAMHTGEAQLRDEGNYFGQAIIRCARLRSCGVGGQVLLSQISANLVNDRLPDGVSLMDLGQHRLKDLHEPEQVWQLAIDGLRTEFPPLSSLDSFRHNLPARVTPLIGREAELAELSSVLASERILTLTGSGGCGKTRLASELGARVVDQFSGGVAWVELAARSDDVGVVSAVADVLEVAESPGEALLDRVIYSLTRRGSVLLVLDNAEHVLDATAGVVAAVFAGAPLTSVVCTSREPLGVPGEVVWRVPSLAAPRLDSTVRLAPAALSQFDAVQLFIDRAGRARRGFRVTDENAPAVAQICSRLDGVPLAIELAAARVRTMPPERIAAQLDDRFRLLAGGPRTLLARQQTLQASVAWSEGLLDETERAVFRRLGVFVGGFTTEAAEAVVGAFGDVDPYEVADVVGRLVDKSLVQMDENRDRYSLLETIRSYALQRLLETDETAKARDRHAEWVASWLEEVTSDAGYDTIGEWWDARIVVATRIEAEWPNCAGTLGWLEAGSTLSLRVIGCLGGYWVLRQGSIDSARYGMPAVVAGDPEDPAWLIAMLELQPVRTNDRDEEFGRLRQIALLVATERSDQRALVSIRLNQALNAGMVEGPTATLLEEFETLRAAGKSLAEWRTEWNATQFPASMLTGVGRTREADLLLANLSNSRELLIRVGGAMRRGELAYAQSGTNETLSMLGAGNGAAMDRVLAELLAAQIVLLTGAPPSETTGRPVLDFGAFPRGYSATAALIGITAEVSAGRLEEARASLVAEPEGGYLTWRVPLLLCQIEIALGDLPAARVAALRLRAICAHLSAPLLETTGDLVLAECDRETDLASALNLAHRALVAAAEFELWLAVVDALEAIGAMLVDGGRPRDAARLLAAAESARDRMNYRHRHAHRARYVAAAHDAAQGDDGWLEGSTLSLPEAVEIAQRMRGERVRPTVGWDSITPTEWQVAELVVAGLSNPQIAERLLMSRGTVKAHMTHLFVKLGVSSRSELAAAVSAHENV